MPAGASDPASLSCTRDPRPTVSGDCADDLLPTCPDCHGLLRERLHPSGDSYRLGCDVHGVVPARWVRRDGDGEVSV